MFTGNTIDLSSIAKGLPLEIVRGCSLSYVGKIPSNLSRRFVPCGQPKHIEMAAAFEDIVGIVTKPEYASLVPSNIGLAIADEPVAASLFLHEALCDIDGFLWEHFDTRIHPTAQIHPSAIIAERDVEIGAGSRVGPGSVLMERTLIKKNCYIGIGVAVGDESFDIFEQANPRRLLKQAGGVLMEDGATVLAKSTVGRATFGGFTWLKQNSMIDMHVHVAHDTIIGANSTVTACAEFSGRCELGDGAYVGPNACIRNGVHIGSNAVVSMGSVVTRDVDKDTTVTGNFAVPHSDWLKFIKSLGKN